jgi:hypothetical protein
MLIRTLNRCACGERRDPHALVVESSPVPQRRWYGSDVDGCRLTDHLGGTARKGARAHGKDTARDRSRIRRPASPARDIRPHSPGASDSAATVAGVRISHPDRVIYPDLGISKLQLARDYDRIADWIVPHVWPAALTLVHCQAESRRLVTNNLTYWYSTPYRHISNIDNITLNILDKLTSMS